MADITETLLQFQRSQIPSLENPTDFTTGEMSNPASVIGQAINNKQLRLYQFPSDIAPHHFTIIEGEAGSRTLPGGPSTGSVGNYNNFSKAYKLPIPTVIQDTHNVKYDHNFNWLRLIAGAGSGLARTFGATPRLAGLSAGVGQIGERFAQGLGYAVNNFKAVTLAHPEFRTFQLEWRLFPKTQQESDTIQKMVISIQTGMHPSRGITSLGGIGSSIPVFRFPNIFLMSFTTGQGSDGSKYLFKFKPAVCNGIQINFQGDQPVPAFYKNPAGQAIPEGITVRSSWIELEVWTKENFIDSTNGDGFTSGDGLYNNDPFSAVTR